MSVTQIAEKLKDKPLELRAHNLVKSFKNKTVVNSVSYKVQMGQVVGLLGPNGAGKTTSFYMIVGLLYPQSGAVYLGEQDITQLPMHVAGASRDQLFTSKYVYLQTSYG